MNKRSTFSEEDVALLAKYLEPMLDRLLRRRLHTVRVREPLRQRSYPSCANSVQHRFEHIQSILGYG